jgi:hypothetical protein
MSQQHPITPPPELIEDWIEIAKPEPWKRPPDPNVLCTLAAQWGADQELEACCALLEVSDDNARDFLQSARRPKAPSLKEQALEALESLKQRTTDPSIIEPLRRALEQLPDHE